MQGARKKGFTLIELLVVIAIIAILAAILYPVYTRVKENGRSNNCRANLKQIAAALELYRGDNQGMVPNMDYWTEDGTDATPAHGRTDWANKLMQRANLKSSIFKCPSDTGTGDCSYANNETFNQGRCGGQPVHGSDLTIVDPYYRTIGSEYNRSNVPHPAKVVTFAEWENGWTTDINKDGLNPPRADDVISRRSGWFTYQAPDNTPDKRHLGKGNYAFWDGHVESLRPENLGRDSMGGGGSDMFGTGDVPFMTGGGQLCQQQSALGQYINPWWGPGAFKAQVKAHGDWMVNISTAGVWGATNGCPNATFGANVWDWKGHNMSCCRDFVSADNYTRYTLGKRTAYGYPYEWHLGLVIPGPAPDGGMWMCVVNPNTDTRGRYAWGTMPTFNPIW